jgi:hypothetical protein
MLKRSNPAMLMIATRQLGLEDSLNFLAKPSIHETSLHNDIQLEGATLLSQ